MREERMTHLARFIVALAVLVGAGLPHGAFADDYPSRPITLIVPYPPGGGVDTIARVMAQKLGPALGQQIIIENRPGAGAVIGTRAAAKAAPDGYTLVMIATGFTLPANTGYEIKDFAPVGTISSTPIVIMSHPSLPVNSLADVIALAKKDPGKLTAGTPPPPTLNYFAIEMMKALAGIDLTIVTYKGTGPLTNDLLGGHVALGFNTTAPALGNIQSGKIRAIAVASPRRSAALPDVPTAAEAGLPGFEAVLYYGIAAPAGTPKPIIERINKEMRAIIASDEISKRIVSDGGDPAPATPEKYALSLARDEAKWGDLIRKLGLVTNNN
jgi:tripartite-type tricarboxylate transporter receptor subunit TctC